MAGKTLVLSDNYYWDSTNIIVKDAGDNRYRNVGNALHDIDWGLSGYVTQGRKAWNIAPTTVNITFNHTFKAAPVVIATLYGQPTDAAVPGSGLPSGAQRGYSFGDILVSVTNVTTTGFTARFHDATARDSSDPDPQINRFRIAWMAVSKMTYPQASAGDGYKLYNTDSDLVLWDIDSIGFQSAQSQFATNKLGSEITPPLIIASSTKHMRIGPTFSQPISDYSIREFTLNFSDLTFRKFKTAPVVLTWMSDMDFDPGIGGNTTQVRRGAGVMAAIVESVSTTSCKILLAHSTGRMSSAVCYFIIIGEEA